MPFASVVTHPEANFLYIDTYAKRWFREHVLYRYDMDDRWENLRQNVRWYASRLLGIPENGTLNVTINTELRMLVVEYPANQEGTPMRFSWYLTPDERYGAEQMFRHEIVVNLSEPIITIDDREIDVGF